MKNILVVGTNDTASACAIRLYRAGFGICMIGRKISFDLFSVRNFSPTLRQGSKTIENIRALSFADFLLHNTQNLDLLINHFIDFTIQNREICILSEKDISSTNFQKFTHCIICDHVLFDLICLKLDLTIISCGDENKVHADYYVETRGKYLGRVKYPFLDFNDKKKNEENDISIFSPSEGIFISEKSPGEYVKENEKIATIGKDSVYSSSHGYILGALSSGIIVDKNREIFRLTTAPIKNDISEIPVKDFAIAGGVLETILFHSNLSNT